MLEQRRRRRRNSNSTEIGPDRVWIVMASVALAKNIRNWDHLRESTSLLASAILPRVVLRRGTTAAVFIHPREAVSDVNSGDFIETAQANQSVRGTSRMVAPSDEQLFAWSDDGNGPESSIVRGMIHRMRRSGAKVTWHAERKRIERGDFSFQQNREREGYDSPHASALEGPRGGVWNVLHQAIETAPRRRRWWRWRRDSADQIRCGPKDDERDGIRW